METKSRREKRTLEEIKQYLVAARDSVWVITSEIEKLTKGEEPNKEIKNNIERNVMHLKLVVTNKEVIESGESTSELQDAIATGEAKLAENIWPQ